MINRLGIHRFDEANIVGHLGGVGQRGTEGGSAFAVVIEGEGGPGERQTRLIGGHAGEALALPDRVGEFLAVFGVESWFVVEQVHLRRSAGLVEENDALRFWCEVGAGEQGGGIQGAERIDQVGQGETTHAQTEFVEKGAAGESRGVFESGAERFGVVHRWVMDSCRLISAFTTMVAAAN